MPSWLVEDPAVLYILLFTIALFLAVAWWRTRQRKLAAGLAGVVLVAGLVWLLDTLIVTDHERLLLNLESLADAARRRDLDRIFQHISSSFRYGGMDRTAFRRRADDAVRRFGVEEITLWDFKPLQVSSASRTASVEFLAKARGNWSKGEFFLCRAEFVLEGDQWRMKGFQLFNPAVDTQRPVDIPGF